MQKQIYQHVLKAGLIFIISICSIMLGMTYKQINMLEKQLYNHASALFELIVYTRQWNSRYGGVFVEKKPGVLSNSYLSNPDITDIKGKRYTKKNPAVMTREISAIAESSKDFTFHITSLNVKNPGNAPDGWEKSALIGFDHGETEKVGIVKKGSTDMYRFMKPLITEESCLACHKEQGYRIGDVRGGISVELPFDNTMKAIRQNNYIMFSLLLTLIIVFGFTLYLFVWKVLQRMDKQRIQLVELNQVKNSFLGMCAHDLRNPLTSIIGFSDLFLNGKLDFSEENNKKFFGIIHSQSVRMLGMVNSLLDISVIESGKLELHLSKGSINALLEEQVEISRLLAEKKSITIELTLSDTPYICFDRERISQVFENIIGNAIKYSPSGSTVYVVLKSVADYVSVSVMDEGPGISKEDQEKMFNEFQRLKAKPTSGEKSTGLGLAIVKKIIEYHHGIIKVESMTGEGSTFIIELPVYQG